MIDEADRDGDGEARKVSGFVVAATSAKRRRALSVRLRLGPSPMLSLNSGA